MTWPDSRRCAIVIEQGMDLGAEGLEARLAALAGEAHRRGRAAPHAGRVEALLREAPRDGLAHARPRANDLRRRRTTVPTWWLHA